MRIVGRACWWGILAVVAARPWVLEFVSVGRIVTLQWMGLWLCVAWWVTRQGWSARRLHPWLTIPCLILFVAFFLSSPLFHESQEAFLEKQGLAFGIALCASAALADRSERQWLLGTLVVTGLLLAVHALWQAVVLFPSLANFPWSQLAPDAQTANFATEVIARRRVFGPFPLPGLLAGALAMLLPISVAVLRPWATTSARRILAMTVWSCQATALLLTQSLGGVSSICVATLIVLTLRGGSWRQKLVMACATAVCVGLILALRPELTMPSHPRNPIVQRWRYWQSTTEMIRDYPILGIGAGNYGSVYQRYRRPLATDTRFAHNAWLQAWAEWGLLGLIGLLGLMMSSLRLAASEPKGVQVAIWAFWLLASIDITWSVLQVAYLWWLLAGLIATTTTAAERARVLSPTPAV